MVSSKIMKYVGAMVLSAVCFINNASCTKEHWSLWSMVSSCEKELKGTHLYILISSYKQAAEYGEKIVTSLEINAQCLMNSDVIPHIIVRCDGEKENGQDVISGDLRTYAEILNEKKVAFKVHKSKGVEPSDFAYEHYNPETAHWELVANEQRFGCSGTRHAGIDMIEQEVKQLQQQEKRVYIGIFDGDDWVCDTYFLLLLSNALYTKAPVSNYNGRKGAHGLEYYELAETWGTDDGIDTSYFLYTNVARDYVSETLSKEQNGSGICCTTKIFEAGYFYKKLDELFEKEKSKNPKATRHYIDLLTLTPLDGFCEGACTCTTKENLFHYTRHGF